MELGSVLFKGLACIVFCSRICDSLEQEVQDNHVLIMNLRVNAECKSALHAYYMVGGLSRPKPKLGPGGLGHAPRAVESETIESDFFRCCWVQKKTRGIENALSASQLCMQQLN
jgi:hypothetical protein